MNLLFCLGDILSDFRVLFNQQNFALFQAFIFGFIANSGMFFFNKQGTSPYVGGGLTVSNASHEYSFERGMGIYGVGGLQMLRTTQNRLKLELRVDRPLYSLESQDVMPISIGIFFSRNYGPGGCGCLF